MKISVIIPSYKPQDYLWECLEALMMQTFSKEDFEIILVLNGCTEPYKSAIERYIAENMQGMNVNFIHSEVGGVSNARNIGLDAARGEYVTFVDDDDIVSSNYLEELLKVSSPTCVGCANSYAFENDITNFSCNFISFAFEKCKQRPFTTFNYRSFLSPPWAKLMHRRIIDSERFSTNLKKGEDGLFCFAISNNIKEMRLTSEYAIYFQRVRNGSAMRRKNSVMNELIEAFRQEKVFFSLWVKYPLSYNLPYAVSRAVGILRNFFIYVTR